MPSSSTSARRSSTRRAGGRSSRRGVGVEAHVIWAAVGAGRRPRRAPQARLGAARRRAAGGRRLRGRRSLRRRGAVPAPSARRRLLRGARGQRGPGAGALRRAVRAGGRLRGRVAHARRARSRHPASSSGCSRRWTPSRARSPTSATGSTTTSCRRRRRGMVAVHIRRGPWGYLQRGAEQAALQIRSLDELPAAFAHV